MAFIINAGEFEACYLVLRQLFARTGHGHLQCSRMGTKSKGCVVDTIGVLSCGPDRFFSLDGEDCHCRIFVEALYESPYCPQLARAEIPEGNQRDLQSEL